MNPRHFTSTLLLCLAGALAGCNGVRLADSVDLELDFNFLDGPSDRLHSPYVAGADFDVYATGLDDDEETHWSIGTSDPSVIFVGETIGRGGAANVVALSPGTVDLIARDDTGDDEHRATVEVVQPDEARLVAHGPQIVRRPELQPENTDELRVLVGGSGTFMVRWFAEGDRLFGHGALSTESDPGVVAEPRRSFLFEDREWVTFHVSEVGSHEVRLFANGELTRTITVIGVTDADIDDVQIHGMDESGASEGEPLVVYAQAYAADGTPIYGVEYQWDLDGDPVDGLGDLFRYGYAPGVSAELCARHGDLEAIATISATGRLRRLDQRHRLQRRRRRRELARCARGGARLRALLGAAPLPVLTNRLDTGGGMDDSAPPDRTISRRLFMSPDGRVRGSERQLLLPYRRC